MTRRTRTRAHHALLAALLGSLAGALFASPAGAQAEVLSARLSGFDEVPLAISSAAEGSFSAWLNRHRTALYYELEYTGFTSPVTAAHIHFGKAGVSGGIMLYLCAAPGGSAPPGTPACPQGGGKVRGTLRAADVLALVDQGIEAGQLPQVLEAIRAAAGYVNVHSETHRGGELRGAIELRRKRGE
jgi:hypothetical protein